LIVDTSILVAIALREPDSQQWLSFLQAEPNLKISAASLVELHIVLVRRIGLARALEANLLFEGLDLETVPVDDRQVALAQHAYNQFGKGRHAAALNFGDCFSYALAKVYDEPLLFKGDDFSQTDVAVVAQ
jgi:ribonuclease VapC